jgi:hypothetical protein
MHESFLLDAFFYYGWKTDYDLVVFPQRMKTWTMVLIIPSTFMGTRGI